MHAAHALAPALLAAALLQPEPVDLTPHREVGAALRVETETLYELETVSRSTEVDGELREAGGTGAHQFEALRVVTLDRCTDADDGRPTVVRREFEEVTLERSLAFGDFDTADEREGPLEGVTLLLRHDGAGPSVSVADGTADDAALLDGHRLELALSALLPAEPVEVGDTWELDRERVRRALALELRGAYFPPPEAEADRRTRWLWSMRDELDELFASGEWTCTATLERTDAELGDRPCAAVRLELEGSGPITDPEGRSGSGAKTFEARVAGTLWVSTALRVPLGCELEGEVAIETERTWERGDSERTSRSRREGNVAHRVTITPLENE